MTLGLALSSIAWGSNLQATSVVGKGDSFSESLILTEARDYPLVYEAVLNDGVELEIQGREGMVQLAPSFDGKLKISGRSVLSRDLASLGQSWKDAPVIADFKVEEPARIQVARDGNRFSIEAFQAKASYELKRTGVAPASGGGGIFDLRKYDEHVQVPFGDIWLRVEIPAELLQKAKVRSAGADVLVSGFDARGLEDNAPDFDVVTDQGVVTLTGLTSKNIKVSTRSGAIWVNGCSGKFNLESEFGDIYSSRKTKKK